MADRVVLQPSNVTVRRVAKGTGDGAVVVNGTSFVPAWDIGGRQGWVSGTVERRLYEEGTGSLRLANAAGSDGQRHIDRLRCLSDAGYLPGDEWLEVYEDGDLVAVWTPTGRQSKRRSELQISGEDAVTLLKRTREGEYGYWNHAPRDAMEHYGRTWRSLVSEGFDATGPAFTYSTSPQTTADGAWTYTRCEQDQTARPGTVRLRVPALANATAFLRAAQSVTSIGSGQPDPHDAWRFDVTLTYSGLFGVGANGSSIFAGLVSSFPALYYAVGGSMSYVNNALHIYNMPTNAPGQGPLPDAPGPMRVTLVKHAGFVYYVVNGRVVGVFPAYYTGSNIPLYPAVMISNNSTSQVYCDVEHISFRRADRLLIENGAGDVRLPGQPTPGGLRGEYFDLASEVAIYGVSSALAYQAFRPGREPDASRIEPGVDFASANPPAWRPASIPATNFSARFAGAIYLDLSTKDIAVRVTADEEGVLWIGNTRATEQLLAASSGTAASTWLKAGSSSASAPSGAAGPLAGQPSGWYPIRLEYKQAGAAGACQLQWEDSTAVGTWTAVPQSALSPYGVYQDQVRSDSHYDALKNIADTFGYQWTCEPRSLEGGQFPGRITPRGRVGRDTEKVLDEPESTDIQADIDLDSRADLLTADASGISDPSGVAQLTAEVENAPAVLQHLYAGQAYESLSEVGQQQLLLQRLSTLLTLRSAVWEEVSARPPGRRELLDAWPLTGALAEFAWDPGDGIRLNFPTVGVVDTLPRQILGLSREFAPNGMKPPAASFRPRPRSVKSLVRELRRSALLPQRNYQQQLAQVTGSLGGTGGVDGFSRITLPALGNVVEVKLVVLYKSDASNWSVYINLVDSTLVATTAGVMDITGAVSSSPGGYNFATLTGGTGTWTIQLQATVRV